MVGADPLRALVAPLSVTSEVEEDVAEARVQFAKLLMWVGQLPLSEGASKMLAARIAIIRDDVVTALRGG